MQKHKRIAFKSMPNQQVYEQYYPIPKAKLANQKAEKKLLGYLQLKVWPGLHQNRRPWQRGLHRRPLFLKIVEE